MFKLPDGLSMTPARKLLSSAILSLGVLGLAACGPTEKKAETTVAATPQKPAVTSPWATAYNELGRAATPAEVAAWDIDVRPDFAGLPVGEGSVELGEEVWLERCATCHGDFGDANKFFSPLVLGNITEADIESGHVKALNDPTRVRTTLMKVATVSTVWDYINRAMPWTSPKSLSADEVYGLVAYLLSLAYIVEDDFVLSNENIAEVQARLPNRNGMTTDHGLWKVDGTPDVHNVTCMTGCETEVKVASFIPQFARNAHGNLQQQMRIFGPFQGINTAGESEADVSEDTAAPAAGGTDLVATAPMSLLEDNTCLGCHSIDSKLIGPAFVEVSAKYAGRDDAVAYLSRKIRQGGSGVWGGMMPPMAQLTQAQAEEIAKWLAQ